MTTTLENFADALGALAAVEARKTGERLFLTGQSYERCTTDAERDGWIAAWDQSMQDRETEIEMELA